ncbi:MAG: hypothetical protein IKD80_03125 [Selenomonadaceae bacterium]|nr:hypothetical protein [Selenomonadaceae bacterium]
MSPPPLPTETFQTPTEILIVDAAPVAERNFSAVDGNFNRRRRARCRPKLFSR